VAAEDGEALAHDEVDVSTAAVDHDAGRAARGERGRRQLAEVGALAVPRRIDGDVPRGNGAEALEDAGDRPLVVDAGPRAPLDGEGAPGEPHAPLERPQRRWQRLP
jgi:hypothetical protein